MNLHNYIFLFFIFIFSNSAFAYAGPGVGLGVIVLVFGFLISFIVILFGILFFPIKRLIVNFKKKNKNKEKKY